MSAMDERLSVPTLEFTSGDVLVVIHKLRGRYNIASLHRLRANLNASEPGLDLGVPKINHADGLAVLVQWCDMCGCRIS